MNNTIVAAIVGHRSWVVRLRTAFTGNNTEVFDLSKIRDDTDCLLGRWLLTEQAMAWLGDAAHKEIVVLHKLFHDMAGSIAEQIKRFDSRENIAPMMMEFDDLSKRLVQTLIQAKTKA